MALIQYINRAWLEAGAVKRLSRELEALGVKRPLLCTDPGIVASGLIEKVRAHWPAAAPFTVFDATPANPTAEAVRAARDLYRAQNCDGLVGLGGGSPIDLAKGVALMLAQKEPLEELEVNRKGTAKIGRLPPLVAIPTTAGTGSEVSIGAIIITDDGRKATFASRHLVPPVALCDPELTLGLPARLTAATGMDAVAHCIETHLSPVDNAVADAIALDGLRRAVRDGALKRAVAQGSDLEARTQMMTAALEGALAFAKGLGAVHAMSHSVGRLKGLNLHHGTLNAVLLPCVMRFNQKAVPEKMRALGEAMGLTKSEEVATAIERLNREIGMPASLGEMGVKRDLVDDLVAVAMNDSAGATNPVRATAEDYRRLYEEA
ncbi:MAG: iron-containing alcohol dehydrogenase, partial [Hyphomicrobiales bacterium]|nr:iron-containing alcohol dehydrogenase [Hyphomicrobiales bacterium]